MYWENIEGSFTFINFYELMIMRFNSATFVEIGTWKGQSIMYLAERVKELNKKIKIYGVDTFKGCKEHIEADIIDPVLLNDTLYEVYLKNIEPLKEYIITIKGNSHDVYNQFEDESIDFLFIDGSHEYKDVLKDLQLWYPKVKTGGIISGHDYTWIDGRVKRAVDQFFLFTGVTQEAGDSWMKIKNK
jgi:predicted O-methyltransferase YrrM